MRILFTTYSDKSLLHSLVPLAWAALASGHEVRVASAPDLAEAITAAGLTAVPVGRPDGFARFVRGLPQGHLARRSGLFPPYDAAVAAPPADRDSLRHGYRTQVEGWHKIVNFPLVTELTAFARHWRPDLVIWEPTSYAGAIAAKSCGAAHARLLWSVDVFGATREKFLASDGTGPADPGDDPLREWLDGYARRNGGRFSEDMVTGHFTIDQLPAGLGLATALPRVSMRYTPYGGTAVAPVWLRRPPERPRIVLTLGITASERFNGYRIDLQSILDAVADLDVEVVATVADRERHTVGSVPANTRVVPYVPLHVLAPTCAAAIDHAGPGTLCTLALHGVPQVLLPWYFDEPLLARRLADYGAGMVVDPARSSGEVVRDNLSRLLTEPVFADRARLLRDEMRQAPSPAEVAGLLPRLVAQWRTPA